MSFATAGHRRRLPAWLAAAVALAVLATGCSGSTAGFVGSAPSAAPSTLAGYYAQRLDWQPCDNGFECARLLVPLDYTRPGGRRFSLPVIKLPAADPSRRTGALVVNPGGPGGSGVQYALGAGSEFPAAVLARFDIVGFDPRGAAASEPALTCMTGPQLDKYLATNDMPANAAQLADVIAQSKLYAARCAQNSAALLPYVGTQNAARDMDVLRAALGEAQLSFLGKSYGTYLGAWYAQLFPRRVRALVLDGAVDPGTASLQDDITQAEGFQVALRSFAAWCLAAASCPLRGGSGGAGSGAPGSGAGSGAPGSGAGSGAPGSGGAAGSVNAAVAKLQGLVARANSVPLANQLGDGQLADGAMLVNGVAAALYSKSYWTDLKTGLTDAFAGNGTVLVQLANLLVDRNPNGTYANLVDADTSISCLDRPWPRSLASWRAAASAAARVAPLFGAPIVWGNLPCAYWPVPSYPLPRIRAAGARPILVVGTLRDPATPYRWAQALAGDLSSGVLLGWNGDGHTAYGQGSACVDTIVNGYLISLSVPRSGTVCPLFLTICLLVTRGPRAGLKGAGTNPMREEFFVKVPIRFRSALVAAAATAAVAGFAAPAFASTAAPAHRSPGARHVVFVQTDNTAGNHVVAYHRSADGALSPAGSYATGGLGGVLSGSVVDHTASQGSLAYDPRHSLLYAVNAGSNTVSVFAVSGDRLALRQAVSSGGTFPVSVAVHDDLVYVLNALNGGSVQGYRVVGGGFLVPLPRSSRALGLDSSATSQFTHTPGQVAFTPDGTQLIVTTKANGNDIDVFGVGFGGRLSVSPVVNSEPDTVPFAISFDEFGNLVIAEAGTNALATFAVSGHGTISLLDSAGTGKAATCWVAPAGPFLYASNAGSADVSGYTSSAGGQLTLLGATGTDAGTVDASASAGGRFLYVQTGGAGIVDGYSVGAGGSLTGIGSVTVPGAAGGEGIVAF